MEIRKNNPPRTEPCGAPCFNVWLTKTWWIENSAFVFCYLENLLLFCELEQDILLSIGICNCFIAFLHKLQWSAD